MTLKTPMRPRIILKKGKEKAPERGHPWVFSGAVSRVEGELSAGDLGEVYSSEGKFLGLGHANPRSQIFVRILTREKREITVDFLRDRLRTAARLRVRVFEGKTNAFRLVNAEGDGLPGLIVDRYGETLVLQCLTAGMDRCRGVLVDLLAGEFLPRRIYERSDTPTRREEGLAEARGLLCGEGVSGPVDIEEHGCRFRVDVETGQKTGFYLDQRENRFMLQEFSEGAKILDCFCYTGAFAVHGGVGGAKEVTLVDASGEALERAREHLVLNGLEDLSQRMIRGDAFEVMRGLDPVYDIVILDPPPFARRKGHLPGASRGYKDLNLQALRLLRHGGLLFTFSCSHHVTWDLFQKVVFSAAVDAGKEVQRIGRSGHPLDHPIDLAHPEGEYLKGILCRVL